MENKYEKIMVKLMKKRTEYTDLKWKALLSNDKEEVIRCNKKIQLIDEVLKDLRNHIWNNLEEDNMKVDLGNIRGCFPKLKRFLARIREDEIILIADKHNLSVDTSKVLECLQSLFVIVSFGEENNKFYIETSIESLEATVEWLGCLRKKDTDILMMRTNMIDNLDIMDKALDTLYRVLADKLEEE